MKQVGDFADLEETDVATRLQLDYQAFASSLSVAEYSDQAKQTDSARPEYR